MRILVVDKCLAVPLGLRNPILCAYPHQHHHINKLLNSRLSDYHKSSTMHFINIISASATFAGLASAAPAVPRSYSSPSTDGFPTPNPQQLLAIEKEADGQLSNAPPPPKIADSSLTAFQLIAFNENFEVAFFSSLIENVTSDNDGYGLASDEKKDKMLSILETIKAVSYCLFHPSSHRYADPFNSKKNSTLSTQPTFSTTSKPSHRLHAPTNSPLPMSVLPSHSLKPSRPSSSAHYKTQLNSWPRMATTVLCGPSHLLLARRASRTAGSGPCWASSPARSPS